MLTERDATTWLHETNWSDDLNALSLDKSLFNGGSADGVLDKVNDDKLARDVEDLSAIFEELEDGVVDFPLPCDDQEVATGAEVTGDWIGDLEKDVVNVEELSAVFDALASEQASALEQAESSEEFYSEDDDEEMYSDDEEEDDVHDSRIPRIPARIVPAPPTWAMSAPMDPRSAIRTPVFKNLDSRIPRVEIPRMDLAFGSPAKKATPSAGVVPAARPTELASPKACKDKKIASGYKHDPASCWICKSDKTPFRKFALHRYLEKRHRRNWKRGPRYSGRSNVATGRVREGGRFVCTAHWV
ncbi:hypothetical protein Poli38472_000900 [Pythium oligandrum]|uniref:CCT domain-containing protein n=1 Tax=Pythium oligandrum TaxID=41045 RepID=A0A8K1CD80_PYTOL|nr:hypothetical protein Poli38472_000900 [Pythium oligandrum]|eukprot:TMW60858.1 hypothetical protein Poli38472_000900 [Pythium oligandrum]